MFTVDIILGVLKKVFGSVFSFLWEYKYAILIGAIIGVLYIRGNNYKEDYRNEVVAHLNSTLQLNQDINDIRLANETALRVAQEESAANYKKLVEETHKIQEKYNERNESINASVNELNAANDSLSKQIREYTNNSNSSGETGDSANAERLSTIGGLLETCIAEQDYFAQESAKLGNSVLTLQEWAEAVIKQNKDLKEKDDER